jgi:uncharacterized membrane protein YgcG
MATFPPGRIGLAVAAMVSLAACVYPPETGYYQIPCPASGSAAGAANSAPADPTVLATPNGCFAAMPYYAYDPYAGAYAYPYAYPYWGGAYWDGYWDYGWPYYGFGGVAVFGGRFHHDFDHRGFRGGGFRGGGFRGGGFRGGGFHGGGHGGGGGHGR